MSWFTERPRPAADLAAVPWLPSSLLDGGDAAEAEAPIPPLSFDERELARIAAASSLQGRHAAEAAIAADPATRLAQAVERLAQALDDCRSHELQAGAAMVGRTVALAAAIARAMPDRLGDLPALATRCAVLLAGIEGPARLILPAAEAEALRPLLPEIAARAGLAGGLELEPDPLLPPGAIRLIWPDGWLEQDPAALAARVAALLAAHDPPAPPTRADGARDDLEPS